MSHYTTDWISKQTTCGGVMMIKKAVDQNKINIQIKLKLLNAIWKGKTRGQKCANIRIFEGELPSPLNDPPELRVLEIACDLAIISTKQTVQKGHGPHVQIHKVYEWEAQTPGLMNAGPGIRKLSLRISSLDRLALSGAREVNNEYKRIRNKIKT